MPTLKYPIGLQSFSEIRKGGYVYVDKTAYIHRLVSTGKYYFLSRPRRFGKSLFLSTLKSYFEGDRELFDGLFISGRVDEWESSPVFYFDFVNFDTSCIEGLQSAVEAHLGTWEEQYGANASEVGYAQRFYGLLKRAVAKTGSRAVVLVDEYDKPLFSTFDNPELNEQYCHILKAIYGTLKAADEYIRFAMLSGVTRFSRLSIFSDLNNLEDISLDTAYSGICGITEGEIEQYLQDGIDEFASKNGLDSTMAMQMLKDNYDGYHFTRRGDDIYNPFSLFRALKSGDIGEYWFATGTPTFLFQALRSQRDSLCDYLNVVTDEPTLVQIDSYSDDLTALLFQTGYLTVKEFDAATGDIKLAIPNREVEQGFFRGLLPVFSGANSKESGDFIRRFSEAAVNGEPDDFMLLLKSFLADIPYDLSKDKPEIYFENNIYIIVKMLGFRVTTEYRTSRGRIDVLIETGRFIYIIELKLDGTAQKALTQIEEREYALPFATAGKQIIKIGANFSKTTRNIDEWVITR